MASKRRGRGAIGGRPPIGAPGIVLIDGKTRIGGHLHSLFLHRNCIGSIYAYDSKVLVVKKRRLVVICMT